ncbi:MAG TPA: FAD-dependent oxidoreductase [Stellaceae bacterium]|nr:FAD-dependent oxidoreductase [Stellaceae bacterium]
MRAEASLVVIGAGIAGCSAAYHLAQLGWRDIVVLDQGPLFHTGGSTSHAPGGLSQINGSRMLTQFANYGLPLYQSLSIDGRPGAYLNGGLEVAQTPERFAELKRRAGLGKSYGVECSMLSPAECAELVGIIDPSKLLGGLFSPKSGVGVPTVISEALARKAIEAGAAEFHGNTSVTGFEITDGRVRAVLTDQGRIACDKVLLCAGIWGPLIGKMAGITIPLQPMQHQYAITEPVAELAALGHEVALPIVRAHDHDLYCRQHGSALGIGNYQHSPLPVDPEKLLDHRRAMAGGSPDGEPSKMAFTPADFAAARKAVDALFPCVAGKGLAKSFNGMFSFTPDGYPLLGETIDVRGFWVAEGVWITHAGGIGKAIAEWMTEGVPSMDLREADINRFHRHVFSRAYLRKRGEETYKYVHAVIHPSEPMSQPRLLRRTPLFARYEALGARFFEAGGWERPQWCEANAPLLQGANFPNREGWAAKYWSPIQAVEHLAVRRSAGMFDMSAFTKLEVGGKGALALLQHLATNQIDVPVGRAVYTSMLTPKAGILCDLTVVRHAADRFWVLTGGASGPRDIAWIRSQARAGNYDVTLTDLSNQYATIGLWGPNSRAILAATTEDDVSSSAIPYFSIRPITIGYAPVQALRVSYVGELGWELYVPAEFGLAVWDDLWAAGQEHGVVAAGFGAMDSLRLEKGYRRLYTDMDTETTPDEAGLDFLVKPRKGDFIGRDALEASRRAGLKKRLACLTLDDPAAVVLGREPILHDGKPVGYVTSANFGYSVGKFIAYGYLPTHLAVEGQRLELEYFGERFGAVVSSDPQFDPTGTRLRG